MAADAYHLTGTHPDGLGAQLCISRALQDAGLAPADINYINAHATSTGIGDISEMKGVEKLFGDLPVHISATKSMTGHLLGAAGAIEAIASIMSIRHSILPPTINTKELDPAIPKELNILLGTAADKKIKVAMSNTFGFGGHNGIVVFRELA